MLRCFGHMERMDEYRMSRRVLISGGIAPLMAKIGEVWVRGRQRLGWMYGVMMAFCSREMTVEAARQSAKDRK